MAQKSGRPPNKIAVLTLDGDERSVSDILRALHVQFGDFVNEGAGTYLVHCDDTTGFPLRAKKLVVLRSTKVEAALSAPSAYLWLWAELRAILPVGLVEYLHSEYQVRKALEYQRRKRVVK